MLRLLADENFPEPAVKALRSAGHDVGWIRNDSPGCSDGEVMSRSRRDNRIILTFDKDFGELVFRAGQRASAGIVLFRIRASSPQHVARIAVQALGSRSDWTGHFSVIDDFRIRMTIMPGSSEQ